MIVKKPILSKTWALCPYCGSKVALYDNTASCSGVWLKCTRNCKAEFELVIKDGQQILPKAQ